MQPRVFWYRVIIIAGICVLRNIAAGTDTLCYGDYQFKSYPSPLQWDRARESCETDFNGYLAKVDSVDLAKKIQETMPHGSSHIGGRRTVGQHYQWQDGTGLSGALAINENGVNLTCLLLFISSDDRTVPYLASADCSNHRKYICQKDKSPPTLESGEKIISTADESITCDGCAPTWLSEDGAEIPLCGVQSYRICQYISSNGSRLRFTNASEGDSGAYLCKTLNYPETFQAVEVKVLGKSEINEIVTLQCSANSTMKWTPGRYGGNYTHTITLSDGQRFEVVPEDESEQSFELTTLFDSTEYTLNISTCESNCTDNFLSSTATFMTGGTTNNISNSTPTQLQLSSTLVNTNQCMVSWNPPNASSSYTSYKVRILETSLSYRHGGMHESRWYHNTTNTSYIFDAKPNMKYEIEMNALNGEIISYQICVKAGCVRPPSAPEIVPTPKVRQSSPSDFPMLTLKVPGESHGLISCILITVSSNQEEDMLATQKLKYDDLQSLQSSFMSSHNNTGHIAVVVSPQRFTASAEELDIALGDGSVSSCDLTETSAVDIARNHTCDGAYVCGNNINLRKTTNIETVVTVIVPSNGSFSVSSSNITTFKIMKQGDRLSTSNEGLVGAVCGAAVLLLVAVLILVAIKKRSNTIKLPTSKPKSTQNAYQAYESPSTSIKMTVSASIPKSTRNVYQAYEVPLTLSDKTGPQHKTQDISPVPVNEYEYVNFQETRTASANVGDTSYEIIP